MLITRQQQFRLINMNKKSTYDQVVNFQPDFEITKSAKSTKLSAHFSQSHISHSWSPFNRQVRRSLLFLIVLFWQLTMGATLPNQSHIHNELRERAEEYKTEYTKTPQIIKAEINEVTDVTNNIGKILSFVEDTAVYIGNFQSLQAEKILSWISESQGEMHFNIQKKYEFQTMPSQTALLKNGEYQKNKFNRIIESCQNKAGTSEVSQNSVRFQQFNPIYTIWVSMLNPKYVTEEVLTLQFIFNPKKLKQPNASSSEPQLGQQTCLVLGSNQWECNFTRMNYTKLWRRSSLDDDIHVLNISYRMKVEAKEDTNTDYNYEEFKIELEIIQVHLGDKQLVQAGELIHFRTKQPLILRDRRLQVSMFCIFVAIIAGLQIHSALKINTRLLLQPALSCKISLFTISYCTISDLSSTIDFAYRVFQTQSNFNRLFYILPTLVYTFLYFGFDIQLLTRVLITQFNNRAFNLAGDNNASFKKILLVFYIAFFFSYEGLVILKAFFQYEWWLIIATSFCIFLPQIVRNVRIGNGGDNRFDHWYVLGFLGTRTFFVMYEHACPQNYEKIKPYLWLALTLTALFLIQVSILFFQSKLGARFFIPKFLRPVQYKYSCKLKYADHENIDNLECAICLHNLFEEIGEQKHSQNLNESQKVDLQKNFLNEVTVFKTPCGHMFHEECLKSWAQIKLECPSCRQKLPVF